MDNLALQRCFNHAVREAAARCPECKNYFCRECVTEHDDRVLCARCLKKIAGTEKTSARTWTGLVRATQVAAGLLLAWFFFFLIGDTLAKLPTTFHDGSMLRSLGTRSR